jgi:hypothetical protein
LSGDSDDGARPHWLRLSRSFVVNKSTALDNPSFETKQNILRLAVERIEFVEIQITIKHVILISDV